MATYRGRQQGLARVVLEELKALAGRGLGKNVESVDGHGGNRCSVTSHEFSCFEVFEFIANQTRFHSWDIL
jgi:hypothetical protein